MIKVSKTVLICPSYNKKEKIYNLKRSYIFFSFIVSVILIVLLSYNSYKTIKTTPSHLIFFSN